MIDTLKIYEKILGRDMWQYTAIILTFCDINVQPFIAFRENLKEGAPRAVQQELKLPQAPIIYESTNLQQLHNDLLHTAATFRTTFWDDVKLAWTAGGFEKVLPVVVTKVQQVLREMGWL